MKRNMRVVLLLAVAMIFGIATPVWAQLANSPWPTVHHDGRFSQETGFPGFVQAVKEWTKDTAGPIRVNVSIDSQGWLYSVQGNRSIPGSMFLKKLNPAPGGADPASVPLPDGADYAQPLIDTFDYIYTGANGRVQKRDSNLNLVGEFNGGGLLVDEHPYGFALANDAEVTLIYAASNNTGDVATNASHLVALRRSDMTLVDVFDVQGFLHGNGYVAPTRPVNIRLPAAVAPDTDLNFGVRDLVYVVVDEGYLIAVPFKGSGSGACYVKPAPPCFETPQTAWDAPFSYSWPGGPLEGSETAPTVSENYQRVYIASGGSITNPTRLFAVETFNGRETAEKSLSGRVAASPVIDVEAGTGKNLLFVHTVSGSMVKLRDDGTSFSKLAESEARVNFTAGHAALGSNGKIYAAFRFTTSPATFRAGAFRTDTLAFVNSTTLSGEDIATRTIGNNNYVYFGTLDSTIVEVK